MAEAIVLVKTVSHVQFLGASGTQLATGMGLEFKQTPRGVSVTHKERPGKRYEIYAANIAHVEWKEVEE